MSDKVIKHSLLILSGGLDSVTMLHEYAAEIALAVYFDYGSNHAAREKACARYQASCVGVEFIEVDLGFMSRYFESSLLSGADAIPDGEYTDDNMSSTVVPFRNRRDAVDSGRHRREPWARHCHDCQSRR